MLSRSSLIDGAPLLFSQLLQKQLEEEARVHEESEKFLRNRQEVTPPTRLNAVFSEAVVHEFSVNRV